MKPVDLWLAAFALRCCALLALELFTFLFAVPTLFDLHSNLADVGAALIGLAAVIGGAIWGAALSREFALFIRDRDDD